MFFSYHPKLVERMVKETPKTVVGLSVLSIIFLLIYKAYIPDTILVVWIIFQTSFIYLRFRNARLLVRYIEKNNFAEIETYIKQFYFLLIYSAVIWNSGAIVGWHYAGEPYEFISLALIMGIITAGTMSLSSLYKAFLVYFFFMLIPQLIIIYQYHDAVHNAILLLSIIYIPFIIMLSKSINKNLIEHINDNEVLVLNVEKLHKISITDNLTQTYNRHYFFETSQNMLNLGVDEQKIVSLLMLDIDYFKTVNDAYGHQAGDMVLKDFAHLIKNYLREGDLFARIGGEEFTILLYDTDYSNAQKIARNICRIIENYKFTYKKDLIDIRVSIGVFSTQDGNHTVDILYQEADKKLYLAKTNGRNCVF